MDLVEDGVLPIYCIFIKDEPHPWRKVKVGRLRPIVHVGLLWQLLELCLFREYESAQKKVFPRGELALGLGFAPENVTSFMDEVERVSSQHGSPSTGDMSGWDGSVTYEELQIFSNVVCLNTLPLSAHPNPSLSHLRGPDTDDETLAYTTTAASLTAFRQGCHNWAASVSRAPYLLNDGTVVSKLRMSLQPSGSRVTTVSNGTMRSAVSKCAGSSACKVNGDDIIEWYGGEPFEPAHTKRMKSFQLNVRDAEQATSEEFNFSSHLYHRLPDGTGNAWLTSYPKMFYAFLCMKKFSNENIEGLYNELIYMPPKVAAPLVTFALDHMLGRPPPSPENHGQSCQ